MFLRQRLQVRYPQGIPDPTDGRHDGERHLKVGSGTFPAKWQMDLGEHRGGSPGLVFSLIYCVRASDPCDFSGANLTSPVYRKKNNALQLFPRQPGVITTIDREEKLAHVGNAPVGRVTACSGLGSCSDSECSVSSRVETGVPSVVSS